MSRLDRLTELSVYGSEFRDLHPSVCGDGPYSNTIDSVRKYYQALGPNPPRDAEVKVFVLGNGAAGKFTLLCHLCDRPEDAYKVKSTHGAALHQHPLPTGRGLPDPVKATYWDFGGQDIYHGTHALFLRSPAVYVIVYSTDTNNDHDLTDPDSGVRVRNRPLAYWFDYLRQVAGTNGVVSSPVLLVRTKCDDPGEKEDPPFRPPAGFSNLKQVFHVGGPDPGTGWPVRGLSFLQERIREAVVKLLKAHPQPPLPASWAAVRSELRSRQQLRSQDPTAVPPTLSLDELAQDCTLHGCPGHEAAVRDAFHQMGVVFYRPGAFADDPIILDQAWALDAVYAVFTRDEPFQRFLRRSGRFTRDDLDRWVWSLREPPLAVADQKTILEFMEKCNVCFRVSGGSRDDTAEYIAPDLLGEREATPAAATRGINFAVTVSAEFRLLHDGILRTYLARLGHIAGDRGVYWRFGCQLHDRRTASSAVVEADHNVLWLHAWGGDAAGLVQTLAELLERVPVGEPPKLTWPKGGEPNTRPPGPAEHRLDPVPVPLNELGVDLKDFEEPLLVFYIVGCLAFGEPVCPKVVTCQPAVNGPQKKAESLGQMGAGLRALRPDLKIEGDGKAYVSRLVRRLSRQLFFKLFEKYRHFEDDEAKETCLLTPEGQGHRQSRTLSDRGRIA